MSSGRPLSLEKMQQAFEVFEKPTLEQLQQILAAIQADYQTSVIELKCLASGYIFQTKAAYSPWIARMQVEKPAKYSKAFLETLAIIAYKQPVTRADIEEIRGVSVNSHIMKTLLDRNWIRIAGVRDVPGKPAVYTTTRVFLDHFNLKSLNELPLIPDNTESLVDNEQIKQTECKVNEQ